MKRQELQDALFSKLNNVALYPNNVAEKVIANSYDTLNHTGTIALTTDRLNLIRFTIDDTSAVYINWISGFEDSYMYSILKEDLL